MMTDIDNMVAVEEISQQEIERLNAELAERDAELMALESLLDDAQAELVAVRDENTALRVRLMRMVTDPTFDEAA